MLTNNQEKIIRSLQTKKGRLETGLCLVEGEKNVKETKDFLEYAFTPRDTKNFEKLVSTTTPQKIAGVARVPQWSEQDVLKKSIIVVLDGVQDPGNIGTILRLCLGFKAALILVESADPANSKVIRSSAGAFFKTPWLEVERKSAPAFIKNLDRPVYRLENKTADSADSLVLSSSIIKKLPKKMIIIAGSEGQGIKLKVPGTSLEINHDKALESLNVATALAIILHSLYK